MSIQVMTNVWNGSASEGSELLVLLALADWADEFGYCHPSLPILAQKTRLSSRTVQRLLIKLCGRGELEKKTGAGMTVSTAQGARTTNLYRVLWGKSSGDKLSTEESSGDKPRRVRVTNRASSGDKAVSNSTVSDTSEIRQLQDDANFRLTGDPEKRAVINWTPTQSFEGITLPDMAGWTEAFPACDVKRQLKAMHQWLLANPERAKKSNWRKFITNWLIKEQDRGGDKRNGPNQKNHPQNPRTAGTALEHAHAQYDGVGRVR